MNIPLLSTRNEAVSEIPNETISAKENFSCDSTQEELSTTESH